MKQRFFITLFLIGILLPLHAQIKSIVMDTDSNPVEFANVTLYSLPDSVLIAGTITNREGRGRKRNQPHVIIDNSLFLSK